MKSIYIKNVKKPFLLFVMLLLLLPCTSAQAVGFLDLMFDSPLETTLHFKNYLGETIYIAVCYYGFWEGTWVCQGWINVPHGQVRSYSFSTNNRYCYFYAEDSDALPLEHDLPFADEPLTVVDDGFLYDPGRGSPVGSNKRSIYFQTVEIPYGYYDYYDLTISFE